MIAHKKHEEIDKVKWDMCVQKSKLPLVYGLSWYLDTVSPGWEAVILNDYEAVMPLTRRKKLGFHYLCQPHFSQQLGVFSPGGLEDRPVHAFLSAIPQRYRLMEISLNKTNSVTDKKFSVKKSRNYELYLAASYPQLRNNFSEQAIRNIKKSERFGLKVEREEGIEDLADLFRNTKALSIGKPDQGYYRLLYSLYETMRARKACEVWKARSADDSLLAGALFVKDLSRLIFLFSATSDPGRKTGAMSALIDRVIRTFSGHSVVLDFEGSNDPNLARFYKGFGSQESIYLQLRKNDLPTYVKFLKNKKR